MDLILTLVTRGTGAETLASGAPGGNGVASAHRGRDWSVVECIIRAGSRDELIAYLQKEAGPAQTDWAIGPQENRRKRLLVADMDSTVIGQECLDELADFAHLKAEVSEITERAMRGELDFAAALTQRVAMLKGLGLDALEKCFAERVRLNPGASELVATMKAHGARCVLVSGGFRFFTSRVSKLAGFDADRANALVDDGSALTGEVAQPILGREAKLAALLEEAKTLGVSADQAIAIGDGANDLDMIRAAGLGVAYKAKPIVANQTMARIDHTDLRAALFFQGYREADIVSS